jgi:hypothetical protein
MRKCLVRHLTDVCARFEGLDHSRGWHSITRAAGQNAKRSGRPGNDTGETLSLEHSESGLARRYAVNEPKPSLYALWHVAVAEADASRRHLIPPTSKQKGQAFRVAASKQSTQQPQKLYVFSSTCAACEIPEKLPIDENSPQRAINPYGASKAMVERMLSDYGDAYGLVWTALRYFNAAGADADCRIGEVHDPETHLIPLVLDAVSGRRSNSMLFGSDYDRPDGTCIRDYIHVADLAEAHVLGAHVLALQHIGGQARSGAYNLGNGLGVSVRQVIDAVERVTELNVPVVFGERRSGDPSVLGGDSTKPRDLLGWQPKFPHLAEIVQSA